uniref:RING-type domain-containing protein n=1 Tax=Heliothis virescens TaxID=7102 RepID=A0A2A4JJS1_HELVI
MCVVDIARDTSDTEAATDATDASDVEYEPVTEPEDDGPLADDDTSANSDNDIIATKVIEVSVGDDGELQFADSERTDSHDSDSEMDLYDYWHCAQCRAENNNPLYRYCHKCFQVRKSFFPPRPRRKRRASPQAEIPRTLSQDSGVDSPMSQEVDVPTSQEGPVCGEGTSSSLSTSAVSRFRKRRADSADRRAKRKRLSRTDSDTDLDSDDDIKSKIDVRPLVKTVSDPAITIEDAPVKVTKKVIAKSLIEKMEDKDLCVICISEPKSGVFVHGRIAHICCCYKCAVKVWVKAKRCPVCNCKVSNVLKAVVM